MTILILNWRDPTHPLAGGAERVLLAHALYWKKRGAQIIWFASLFSGAAHFEKKDGITYIRKGSHYTVHLLGIWSLITQKIGPFDKVIDCFHFIPFFTPLYISRKKIIALIHEVAGAVWFDNLPLIPAFIGMISEKWILTLYKKIRFITVSPSTKKELINVGIKSSAITICQNGSIVSFRNLYLPKEKDPTILFLGRISKDKGIQDAISIFSMIQQTIPQAKMWIIGKEETKGILTRLFSSYKNEPFLKRITYMGYVSEKKKFILLRKAWLLMHVSKKEGWGLTVLEAASQGTPTVGYDVAGLRDSVLNGQTGILVPYHSPLLIKKTISLLLQKNVYNKYCKNSLSWQKQFRWDKSLKLSWALLQKSHAH